MSVVDAWQGALAAEHEAVFGYGLLGPLLAPARRGDARDAQAAHIALRNATGEALTAAGQKPVPSQADYPALYPVTSAKAAIALAITLEAAAAAAWRYFYAELADDSTSSAALRAQAQAALTSCAVRATQWRIAAGDSTPTVAFPGI
jgi:hypothetical protein